MADSPEGTRLQLKAQFTNPGDILSLLLLVGGDVVQRAIGQLFGYYTQPFKHSPKLYLTPVAFSFGWVAYAFTSLASVIGDNQLMPSASESPAKVINCDSGYGRVNRSWILGRLLRDHELNIDRNPGPEHAAIVDSGGRVSLRIDIFHMDEMERPDIDWLWWLGWVVIIAQVSISIAPWVKYGDWGVFLVTASGTLFALTTASLRQWNSEKWPGRRLNKPGVEKSKTKTVCLTRGNGFGHAMILIGSGTTWDLETLATASSVSFSETPWLLAVLAFFWTCLLVTVSGLKQNTWFLIGIGMLGMVQNIVAASVKRSFGTLGFKLTPHANRPCIIAAGRDPPKSQDDPDSGEDIADPIVGGRWSQIQRDPSMIPGVRGALRELEKMFPKAGAALMPEFFPALLNKYEPQRYRTNAEKRFWKKAFHAFGNPVQP